ncbi:uncharacterized protein B0I36DRAFT_369705 [Microdochium trichocladiopsis]|uniref:Uncharacterized protein n=1 Tax=Microdochium trichocladiopsis TaxID=1682393 RepID=A0A9P8XSM9_9PEZI|nr:uncharacterized protein B0I36DRAFT_369705 [Microdochium trichocladiopsis]KAH7012553.1 hypothetical protein B0I36DRAFT_369705 [Microdochium trichocladiopsis]
MPAHVGDVVLLPKGHPGPDRRAEHAVPHLEYYPTQASLLPCRLRLCAFKSMGGPWICCVCRGGPNSYGWCTAPLGSAVAYSAAYAGVDAAAASGTAYFWDSAGFGYTAPCGHGCCSTCEPFAGPDAPEGIEIQEYEVIPEGSTSESRRSKKGKGKAK